VQAMVAMYIYASLRREEAIWLTGDDVDIDSGNSSSEPALLRAYPNNP